MNGIGEFGTSGTSHVDGETLLELASGTLSPESVPGLLEHLRRCPACEEGLRAAGAEVETLRSRPSPVRDGSGRIVLPGAPGSSLPGRRTWAILSAGLAAAAVLAVALLRHSPEEGIAYVLPPPGDAVVLRSADPGSGDLAEGLGAYETGDFSAAASRLSAAGAAGATEDIRLLYLASALTHAGKDAAAIAALDSLDERTLPYPWNDRAGWVRYVACVHLGRNAEAERVLTRLAAREGEIGDLARERRRR